MKQHSKNNNLDWNHWVFGVSCEGSDGHVGKSHSIPGLASSSLW